MFKHQIKGPGDSRTETIKRDALNNDYLAVGDAGYPICTDFQCGSSGVVERLAERVGFYGLCMSNIQPDDLTGFDLGTMSICLGPLFSRRLCSRSRLRQMFYSFDDGEQGQPFTKELMGIGS